MNIIEKVKKTLIQEIEASIKKANLACKTSRYRWARIYQLLFR